MGSLASERVVMEEGISLIKNAKLEFATPVSEMYAALQRQYTQVRTIKLQGKAQDYVKKVLHDSKFFCILTKLITQAITQSKNNKQQTINMSRVHKWYTNNLHKLHFAEQPAFRRNDDDIENQGRKTPGSAVSRNSAGSKRLSSSPNIISRMSSAGVNSNNSRTDDYNNERVIRASSSRLSRPKSVSWRETHEETRYINDETGNERKEETWETDTCENKSELGSIGTPTRVSTPNSTAALETAVYPVSDRRTPDYHLVDDDSYIDNITQANVAAGEIIPSRNNTPVSRPFTPVVYDYIEQIQREVNKVQGHPSDLYPELFTPHIVNAIIGENEELHPMPRPTSEDKGRNLREKSIEQFFNMTETYQPNNVKRFNSLKPRRERKHRPRSSLALISRHRPQTASSAENRSLQMKDVVGLADFASAEISYEKESGFRAVLNRPKDTPPTLPNKQLAIEPPPSHPPSPVDRASSMRALPAPIESGGSPTQSMNTIVDWRGTVTPTCNESQQEVFKSHSYARTSARLSAQGRSVGGTSAGFRPKTAPVSQYTEKCRAVEKVLPGTERIAQAASNNVIEMDKDTTKTLLNITNIKAAEIRRHRSAAGSVELFGKEYMDYLTSRYAVPPSSVYEYESYPYEYEPIPKSYQFMEDQEGVVDDPPSPRVREYMTIVQSIAPDIERLRVKSLMEMRNERLNSPVSSVKTKEDSELKGIREDGDTISEQVPLPEDQSSEKSEMALEVVKRAESPAEKAKRQKSQQKELVQSPMFQFSAYPTPSGTVLRSRSPPGRAKTIKTRDNPITERAASAVNFEPPFNPEHFERPTRPKPKSAGKLASSMDKSQTLVQTLRSAPSIPSIHGTYGCRSPRQPRNHPYSGEHDRSAHKQLNPQEYINNVNSMRALDVIPDTESVGKDNGQGEITQSLSVRPMSSTRDLTPIPSDLSVYNAIKFERPRLLSNSTSSAQSFRSDVTWIPSPDEHPLHPSPTFLTESGAGDSRPRTSRPRSSMSSTQSRPDSSRPIPQYMKAEHWEKIDADSERQREAAAAVSIQKIFRGYVNRKAYLKLKRSYREDQENKRISAVTIQRSWRHHQSNLKSIYNKPTVKPETLQWAKEFKQTQSRFKAERVMKRDSETKVLKQQVHEEKEKLSLIGPHVEVYSAYHRPKSGFSKKQIHNAAAKIQKVVRGRQCRAYLNMVKDKAKWHSNSWSEWVKYYKQFLRSILRRRGDEKPSIEINLEQMQKFMAQKKRYEGVFNRRSFGGELDEDEVVAFFKECDLMPAQHEIDHAMDLVFHGKPRSGRSTLKKREVLDLVFEIYKPEGTGITDDRKSTWLHPIVDGEDAMKLLGSDLVEPAPLGPCIQLVAASMKERKEKAEEEERLRLLAEQTSRRQDAMSVSSEVKSTDSKRTSSKSTDSKKTLSKPGAAAAVKVNGDGQEETGSTSLPSTTLPIPNIFSNDPLYSPKK